MNRFQIPINALKYRKACRKSRIFSPKDGLDVSPKPSCSFLLFSVKFSTAPALTNSVKAIIISEIILILCCMEGQAKMHIPQRCQVSRPPIPRPNNAFPETPIIFQNFK